MARLVRAFAAATGMLILLFATSAGAQTTIPELISRGINPVQIGLLRDVEVPSLEELSLGADVIVDAKVVEPTSYLAENKTEVHTDYLVQPMRMLADRGGPVRRAPGVTRMILTLRQGTIVINGVTVQFDDDNLASFASGDRFLLFLKRVEADRQQDERFVPFSDIAGLLKIESGRTRSMVRTQGRGRDIDDMSVDAVTTRVLSVRAGK